MSEVHVEDHDTMIKTPQQLIVVVLLAFLVPVIGIVMIASFATGGLKVDTKSSAASDAAVAERLKPVGSVSIGEVPTQLAGAIRAMNSASSASVKTAATGSEEAGKEALYNIALHGENAMPAKGGMAPAPDADVKAAVDYLVSQAK